MNINVPKHIKSPTVIIVGSQQPDEKMNEMHHRRMDILERKLDDQYRAFTDHKDYIRLIEKMQKSFMDKFDRLIATNKSALGDTHNRRIAELKADFNAKIRGLSSNGTDKIYKSFINQFESLEKAIKEIPNTRPIVKVVRNNTTLDKSFVLLMERLERAVRESRPRVFPSPS